MTERIEERIKELSQRCAEAIKATTEMFYSVYTPKLDLTQISERERIMVSTVMHQLVAMDDLLGAVTELLHRNRPEGKL